MWRLVAISLLVAGLAGPGHGAIVGAPCAARMAALWDPAPALGSALVRELRTDLDVLAQMGPAQKDQGFWLHQIFLHPNEARMELERLHRWTGAELQSLSGIGAGGSWKRAINSQTRFLPFRVALASVEGDRRLAFQQHIAQWAQETPTRISDLKRLIQKVEGLIHSESISLFNYLDVFSDYLNHFTHEPTALWKASNRYYPAQLTAQRFTYHKLIDQDWLFPHSIYLPTTQVLPLESFNDRFASGIYPVGVLRGGTVLHADGVDFLSPFLMAAHDLAHLPFRSSIWGGPALNAEGLLQMRRIRLCYRQIAQTRQQRRHEGFLQQLDALYLLIFRERGWGLADLLASQQPENLVNLAHLESMPRGNFELVLGEHSFKGVFDIEIRLEELTELIRFCSRR